MESKVFCARCSDYHAPGPPCMDAPEFQCCICKEWWTCDMQVHLELTDKTMATIKSVCLQSSCVHELYYNQKCRIAALEKERDASAHDYELMREAKERAEYMIVTLEKELAETRKENKRLRAVVDAAGVCRANSYLLWTLHNLEDALDRAGGEKRCTCDDPGHGQCPQHGRENQLQDELIKARASAAEVRKKTLEGLRKRADLYEKDGKPGPLGLCFWGWRDFAAELRRLADSPAKEGG